MPGLWYAIVALTLTAWAVLDGFDFGAGIVSPVVARTEAERGAVLAAIGPVWDGNEVWLIAGGGVFVFAFPHAYAVAMSGMYLPVMLVLWLLIARGSSIEMRGQLAHPLWRRAWDSFFLASSLGMAFVAGVAVGIVVRGVPIDDSGWFELDLFTLSGSRPAAVDGYTGAVGALAVVVLAAHGASYLAWKTTGEVRARAVRAARRAWWVALPLGVAVTVGTWLARPAMFTALAARPWIWPFPLVAFASPVIALGALAHGRDLRGFLASSAFVASLLLATAGCLSPVLLPSTLGAAFDLEARSSSPPGRDLTWGLWWWVPAAVLAVLYFVNLFRRSRGRVEAGDGGHG